MINEILSSVAVRQFAKDVILEAQRRRDVEAMKASSTSWPDKHVAHPTGEPGAISVPFHAGQLAAWESERRWVAIVAGTKGGKTSFDPWWLWREI